MTSPQRSTDIQITGGLRAACLEAGVTPVCFYWNIHGHVVLTVRGSKKAYIEKTPVLAIGAAGYDVCGGL